MTNFKESAYKYIKEKIINCEYKPGEVLDLNAIKDELHLSRTPVRDAITTLEQENLVTVLPRRGVIVTSISFKEISDIFTVRENLEPFIARQAASHADPEMLKRFKKQFTSQTTGLKELNRLDYEFHLYLVNTLNNPYISSLMDQVLTHNMRFIVLGSMLPVRLQESNSEHTVILDALLAGDGDKAEKLMIDHMKNAKISAYNSMDMSLIKL